MKYERKDNTLAQAAKILRQRADDHMQPLAVTDATVRDLAALFDAYIPLIEAAKRIAARIIEHGSAIPPLVLAPVCELCGRSDGGQIIDREIGHLIGRRPRAERKYMHAYGSCEDRLAATPAPPVATGEREELRERLAALEHERRVGWTRSDREQVDQYWPLIEAILTERDAARAEVARLREWAGSAPS